MIALRAGVGSKPPTIQRCRGGKAHIRHRGAPLQKSRLYASQPVDEKPGPQETTEKYGLEAGLLQVLTSEDEINQKESKTDQAKRLLAQYGSAYLITSISFALVSFGTCYFLVDAGVDVSQLLNAVGIHVEAGSTQEQVGTFAIAYAAHKALSPVRFPPTVALTPVVANWLGQKKKNGATD